MEAEPKKYWCFVCELEFISHESAQTCQHCKQSAIQAINQFNSSPLDFQTYQIKKPLTIIPRVQPPPIQNIQPAGFSITNNNGVMSIQFNQMINPNSFGGHYENHPFFGAPGGIFNLMNQLLSSGRTLTAASSEQLKNLQEISIVKQCSICQEVDEQEIKIESNNAGKRGFRLKCNHTFHKDCLKPWFQKTNTCPCCRVSI